MQTTIKVASEKGDAIHFNRNNEGIWINHVKPELLSDKGMSELLNNYALFGWKVVDDDNITFTNGKMDMDSVWLVVTSIHVHHAITGKLTLVRQDGKFHSGPFAYSIDTIKEYYERERVRSTFVFFDSYNHIIHMNNKIKGV